jgi:PKD repeat protein
MPFSLLENVFSLLEISKRIFFNAGTDLSFRWSYGDGTPDDITKVPYVNHTFINKGCYNVNCTAYNLVSSNSSKLYTICVQDTVIGIAINGSISGPGLNANFVVSVSQGSDYTCNMTTGDGGSLT